jgi:predicted nucleotidyltransferase component of viral defense system
MIELIKAKLKSYSTDEEKYNYLREYLQIIVLSIIDELGFFRNISFVGGTALRIIHHINRYSEDLDFSLVNHDGYDFEKLIAGVLRGLSLRGFDVDVKEKKQKTAVQSTFIKFTGVLYEAELAPIYSQKLAIKFEVDTNPPLGYRTEFSSFVQPFVYGINHFDKPSLMSGKLHAILQRKYEKGRDYYDLLWYLLSGVEPNLDLLNNSLKQTTKQDPNLNSETWKKEVLQKISSVNFKKIHEDLLAFLIYKHELKSISKETFVRALERVG